MTFEEYLKKRLEAYEYILRALKDDESDVFVYQVTFMKRQGSTFDSGKTKLYKKIFKYRKLCAG